MSNNIANSVLLQSPSKSTHNLTETLLTTTGLGRLTPVYVAEVVPGDSVDLNAEFLTKFQPMATPAFQNFNAYVHFFYVPFRILWKNWEWFIQNIPVPGGSVPPVPPYIDLTAEAQSKFDTPSYSKVHNYFGFKSPSNTESVNALPYAAYQLIYNEYYRAEDVTTDEREKLWLLDGDNATKLGDLDPVRYRNVKDDYFLAALTAPQSGNEASLTLLTQNMLPVRANDLGGGVFPPGDTDVKIAANTLPSLASGSVFTQMGDASADPDISGAYLYVNPSEATFQITQNDLIELNRMQEFLIRQNLAGTRYNEYILAMFGVHVPDLRINRPDYICGIKAPVTIGEVLNTAADQGTQSGQGNSYAEGGRGNYSVLEHGLVIGIYSCLPQQIYMQSIQRLFWKRSFTDYYAPIFDQMGEREVINKELVQNHVDPYGTFGYVPKFAEYRLTHNKITGEFGSNLQNWHLARNYANNVVLDSEFPAVLSPQRVFDITDHTIADSILLWIVIKCYMTRPMKMYSMPTLTNDYGNNLS